MQRVASIWLPQFPIERLRRCTRPSSLASDRDASPEAGDAGPFALVGSGPRGLRITAVDAAAARAGLVVDQPLADARAMLPGLRTRPAEFARDAAALTALAHWAGRYGPSRNVEGRDGLWVDITGVAHLFGGEAALLKEARQRLAMAGYTARLGVAGTPAAAWALARYGGSGAVHAAVPGEEKTALAPLPVEALRLSAPTVVLLKRLGLYRIGDLYGLPRASLARRFRDLARRQDTTELADGVVLRLDQALGHIRDPRAPMLPPAVRIVRRVFAEPLISPPGLEAAVTDLITALTSILQEAAEGARRLQLALYRTDGTQAAIVIGTSTPCRDSSHIARLLEEKLTAIDLGFGVDVATLEALQVEPFTQVQAALASRSDRPAGASFAELVDRIANRIGADAIYRIAARQSHIPEQADIVVPADAAVVPMPSASGMATRPPFLLPRPEPIEVIAEVPEGPPRRFLWRRARHRVVKAEGPERIEPAWWLAIGAAGTASRPRDYYRIEDDQGGRFWVYRAGFYDRGDADRPPAWYVHGLFG